MFNHGNPETLFRGTYFANPTIKVTPWDIHHKEKKFLMIKPPEATGETTEAAAPQQKIIIVTNWFEDLKKKVPVD